MQVSAFDYDLPEQLIAQEPLAERDASRMLILDRATRTWIDSHFADFPQQLRAGDLLVINNTKVFPARLIGQREPSGGRVEALLVRELEPYVWEALVKPGRRLRQGAQVSFAAGKLRGELLDASGSELRQVRFHGSADLHSVLDEFGEVPLPPYISRPAGVSPTDRERYQTLFARERGAIAAPTAGLHFTPKILEEVAAQGAQLATITLHVGYGTFEPVRVDDTEQHQVAAERYHIDEAAAKTINEARAQGRRIIAVGTTTTRALESAANDRGLLQETQGSAGLTIVPGYKFRIVDALLTNFHLPRSSLLMLVSAFAGHQLILNAYRHAVAAQYRFYSYGDCMLLI
ncbi:MAG TPA: tRNA preQ1(34) S-adenosylmethionine ribosyltransferase-isomerase QueA [Pyrinomonadaceae bacterium]|nr:tRNA preQ1(34) S-adenosylmethionine ribosyltransferase-isomerase QueA [Pyrinomonadaceae bacterium]